MQNLGGDTHRHRWQFSINKYSHELYSSWPENERTSSSAEGTYNSVLKKTAPLFSSYYDGFWYPWYHAHRTKACHGVCDQVTDWPSRERVLGFSRHSSQNFSKFSLIFEWKVCSLRLKQLNRTLVIPGIELRLRMILSSISFRNSCSFSSFLYCKNGMFTVRHL